MENNKSLVSTKTIAYALMVKSLIEDYLEELQKDNPNMDRLEIIASDMEYASHGIHHLVGLCKRILKTKQ